MAYTSLSCSVANLAMLSGKVLSIANFAASSQDLCILLAQNMHLCIVLLNVFQWSLARDGVFVFDHDQTRIRSEVHVQVLKRAHRGFWVEQIDHGQENRVCDYPDWPELPTEILETNRCDLDDDEILGG